MNMWAVIDHSRPPQRLAVAMVQSHGVFSPQHASPGEKVSTVKKLRPLSSKDNGAPGEPIVEPSGPLPHCECGNGVMFTMRCYKQGRLIDPRMRFGSQTPTDVTFNWAAAGTLSWICGVEVRGKQAVCCCTGGNRKDTCGQRCTTVWRARHSPVWSYCVVPPGHHPGNQRKRGGNQESMVLLLWCKVAPIFTILKTSGI